jgi:hypothetical protein
MRKFIKKNLGLLKGIVNILKEDMEDYCWAMFTHAMDFLQKRASLKMLIQVNFFASL